MKVCAIYNKECDSFSNHPPIQKTETFTSATTIGLFTASPAEIGCLLPDLFLAAYSAERLDKMKALPLDSFLAAYSAERF